MGAVLSRMCFGQALATVQRDTFPMINLATRRRPRKRRTWQALMRGSTQLASMRHSPLGMHVATPCPKSIWLVFLH